MRGNLFESILANILKENVDEVILNPNDNTKDMFDFRCVKNQLFVFAYVDGDDFKKVSEIDPSLIHNKKFIRVVIPLTELDDPNSEGYQKLGHLCDVLNGLGKYGTFTPEQVLDDASKCVQDRVRPETRQEVAKSEDELFDELVQKFGEERIQELLKSLKLHTNIPLAGIDHQMGVNNIMRILSQDPKRVAAGKKPAVYVAKPEDWRMFNRDIKRDAMPFFLWYKPKETDLPNWAFDQGATNLYGSEKDRVLNGRTAKQAYNDYAMGGSRTLGPANALNVAAQKVGNKKESYEMAPYYDVDDTFVIPGLEDKFNDPERIGYVNNIKMIPTDASVASTVDDEGNSVQDAIRKELGGTDDKCTIEVFNALKSFPWSQSKAEIRGMATPTNQNGEADIEQIRSLIYKLIVKYLTEENYEMKQLHAKEDVRLSLARVIACLYMSIHRIAPEQLLINLYNTQVNKDNIKSVAEQNMFTNRNIYNSLAKAIELAVNRNRAIQPSKQQNNQNKQIAMEESIGHANNPLEAIRQAWGIVDNTLNNQTDDMDSDGISLTPEQRNLTEARFYSWLNKLNNPNF